MRYFLLLAGFLCCLPLVYWILHDFFYFWCWLDGWLRPFLFRVHCDTWLYIYLVFVLFGGLWIIWTNPYKNIASRSSKRKATPGQSQVMFDDWGSSEDHARKISLSRSTKYRRPLNEVISPSQVVKSEPPFQTDIDHIDIDKETGEILETNILEMGDLPW